MHRPLKCGQREGGTWLILKNGQTKQGDQRGNPQGLKKAETKPPLTEMLPKSEWLQIAN